MDGEESEPTVLDNKQMYRVNTLLLCRRMLKQISVVGVMEGEEVNHMYSYINFRPYIAPDGAFDVCAIVPKGANCDCAGKRVRL